MTDVRAIVRHAIGLDASPRPERDSIPCPSDAFEPGEPSGACWTDGHYECAECANADREVLREREEAARG